MYIILSKRKIELNWTCILVVQTQRGDMHIGSAAKHAYWSSKGNSTKQAAPHRNPYIHSATNLSLPQCIYRRITAKTWHISTSYIHFSARQEHWQSYKDVISVVICMLGGWHTTPWQSVLSDRIHSFAHGDLNQGPPFGLEVIEGGLLLDHWDLNINNIWGTSRLLLSRRKLVKSWPVFQL